MIPFFRHAPTVCFLLSLSLAAFGHAKESSATCVAVAREVEQVLAIPSSLLQAIVLVESGGNSLALNVGGQAFFPTTHTEAIEVVRQNLARRNVDVGCGQISTRHHPERFRNGAQEMLDPIVNLIAAGRLLLQNRDRYGTWTAAVAHYHSGDPERQRDYVCRVAYAVAKISQSPLQPGEPCYTGEQNVNGRPRDKKNKG